ncbi:TlpA family protein disulfide reductase [Sapientia aquatica]|uniref:TlpA family protein disulfide reductase n=1 Tax=Sapientia aquatica TaxID=1549640 RepID=A0A4R5W5I4_9BURK|nr:TlpA disulfide reductase family protein [Sapientia aquatica]TDK68308.1 TlpA family protein disulfide reductase [Sapientia aquatica]
MRTSAQPTSLFASANTTKLVAALFFCACSFHAVSQTATPEPATVAASASASAVDDAEQQIRIDFNLEKYPTITYLDSNGNPTSATEFLKHINAKEHFSMVKTIPSDGGPRKAILSLKVDAPEPENRKSKLNIKLGDTFPEFQLKQVDGSVVTKAAMQGRYTLINFYFAECAPCNQEILELNALAQQHKNMHFMAVTFDSVEDTKAFVVDKKFSWPVVPNQLDFINKIGIGAYPSFVLLNPKGVVIGIEGASGVTASDKSVSAWVNRLVAASSKTKQ